MAAPLLAQHDAEVNGSTWFDGTDDRISYADSPAADAFSLAEYLILAWIMPGSGGNNNGRIFARAATGAGGPVGHMQLLIGDGGNGSRNQNFTARQLTTGTNAFAVSATGIIPNDAWSCIGAHYEAAAGANPFRLFEAGAEIVPSFESTASGTQDMEDDQGFTIGNSFAGDRPYQGRIACIAVYDVSSLTNTEIDTLVADFHNSGTGTRDVPQQSLLVEFVRLVYPDALEGDKGILLSPSKTGGVAAPGPPVVYNPLGGSQSAALTTTTETDSAPALGRVKTKAIATATSTETALALGRRKTRVVTVAVEVDVGQALGRAKTKTVGLAGETDTAGSLTAPQIVAIATAVETAAAIPLGRVKTRAVATAAETSSAIALARTKLRALAAALETHAAQTFARRKTRPVAAAGELDEAQTITAIAGGVLATALETDAAPSLGRRKTKPLALASETDTAAATAAKKTRAIATAVETSGAQQLGRAKTRQLATALEASIAGLLGRLKRRLLGTAGETDTAIAISPELPATVISSVGIRSYRGVTGGTRMHVGANSGVRAKVGVDGGVRDPA